MTAQLIDGKAMRDEIEAEVAAEVEKLRAGGVTPGLAAVLVGDDPGSAHYVRNKQTACQRVGIRSTLVKLPAGTPEAVLLRRVAALNADRSVHGILVQLPLPSQIAAHRVQRAVSPLKDVDALHPENVGLLVQGRPRFRPCTPYGIQEMLARSGVQTAGAHAVIVGRSEIVGKPMALLLMQKGSGVGGQGSGGGLPADATVTVCHSRTRDVGAMTRQADILIVAIGRPRFVTAEMVKPGATVIDVGINRVGGRWVGDVDFERVREVAGLITPVPGGVGPMTIAMLLRNTLEAARAAKPA